MAAVIVAMDLRRSGTVDFFTPARDIAGTYRREHHTGPEIDAYVDGWRRIWGTKHTAAIQDLYFHGAMVAAPGGAILSGHHDIDRFVISYLASFPDAEFSIQSAIVNRDPGQPVRIATSWALQGTHCGFGHFGPPTGAPVYIMGMNQAHMVNGKVTAEWLLTDEVAIYKQIIAHQESKAGA